MNVCCILGGVSNFEMWSHTSQGRPWQTVSPWMVRDVLFADTADSVWVRAEISAGWYR